MLILILHETNFSDGISKFTFDAGVHRPPFHPRAFIDRLGSLVDPKRFLSATLATPVLSNTTFLEISKEFMTRRFSDFSTFNKQITSVVGSIRYGAKYAENAVTSMPDTLFSRCLQHRAIYLIQN
ncbi:hypothetical protein T4B_11488 [Trichinella pseudospiralis]|uniref:Uncharacterized protein n=1 Tax=Trichinella pseudospiralis TaxID=6337 RepID=A0A0V1IYD6_TRIPS|nr:hypothetical protein T4B_11488 [Trichinella pseudospiralis]